MHVKDLVSLRTYRFIQIAFDVSLEQTKNTKKMLKYKKFSIVVETGKNSSAKAQVRVSLT